LSCDIIFHFLENRLEISLFFSIRVRTMKVVVTGGSGASGSYVVRELIECGHEVFNFDRADMNRVNSLNLPATNSILADLTDAGQVYDAFAQVRPDAVCHLAAVPLTYGISRELVFKNNVISCYNVLQAAGDLGVKRFISASSEIVSGWLTSDALPPQFPFDETVQVPTPNAYGMGKQVGEVMADSMAVRYRDMAIVSLRINSVMLPERPEKLLDRRKNYLETGFWNYWSYIDARDVATAFAVTLEGESQGHEVFNVASNETYAPVPLAEAIESYYKVKPNMHESMGPFDSAYDSTKIKRVFGWSAQHSWRSYPGAQ
jgi:UDP-glucose 4-epimerase